MGYRSFGAAMKERFGSKVYRLTLDGGMTCPNRDGTLGTGGCLFCGASGAGDFAAPVCGDIAGQLEMAKKRVAHKNRGGRYLAYFQSFTNTYAPVDYLEGIFRQAMASPEVVALSVATRPDCLPSEVIQLLQALNREKSVWVELGLQTTREDIARLIRRGYALAAYDRAVSDLKKAGLEVVVHMILGLPGETRAEMEETARYIGKSGADGIKLQLLHVLRNTGMEALWRAGSYRPLELEEYITLVEACLEVLPPDMVIHRITGDGPKRDLLAPLWSGDKKRVLNAINRAFARDDLQQGRRWSLEGESPPGARPFKPEENG